MDPVTALGLVSSVVGIVDFTATILSEAKRVADSSADALPENANIDAFAKQIRDLAKDINDTNAGKTLSKGEAAVCKLAERCSSEADALVQILEPLKLVPNADGTTSKRKAAAQIIRTKFKSAEIGESRDRLENLQRQLATLLLYVIRTSQVEEMDAIKKLIKQTSDGAVSAARMNQDAILDHVSKAKRELLDRVKSLEETTTKGFDSIEQKLSDERKGEIARSIADSLAFPDMNTRQDTVETHHRTTFDWIFDDSKTTFKQWLTSTSNNELFWICGEAASGKSTLMKYIREHEDTQDLVQLWAGKQRVGILQHYFWAAGNPQQSSLDGMLQTLLHQALSAFPNLAETATPARWQAIEQQQSPASQPWTHRQLQDSLLRVAKDVKLAIFIDGLDECVEKAQPELLKVLSLLTKTGNVKSCASSRPWPVFQKVFGNSSNALLVQKLNEQDIRTLVCDKLNEADPDLFSESRINMIKQGKAFCRCYWEECSHDESRSRNFVENMVEKAGGSFLWVTLVLETVCSRLEGGEELTHLLRHLQSLPDKLEAYFEQRVYGRIAETYRSGRYSETAMALKIAIVCTSERVPDSFVYMWLLRQSVTAQDGMVFQEDFGTRQPLQEFSRSDLKHMLEVTAKYLDVCCKGLLWVVDEPGYYRTIRERYIGFRHRTIYEFLQTERMHALIHEHVPQHFNGTDFWQQLSLAGLKHLEYKRSKRCQWIFGESGYVLGDSHRENPNTVAAFENLLVQYMNEFCTHKYGCIRGVLAAFNYVLAVFIKLGFHQLLSDTLRRRPGFAAVNDSWLLFTAINSRQPTITRLLLDCGADPNGDEFCLLGTSKSQYSPWSALLSNLWGQAERLPPSDECSGEVDSELNATLAEIMIRSGADLWTIVNVPTSKSTSGNSKEEWRTAVQVLKRALPTQYDTRLRSLVRAHFNPSVLIKLRKERLQRIQHYDKEWLHFRDRLLLGRVREVSSEFGCGVEGLTEETYESDDPVLEAFENLSLAIEVPDFLPRST